MDRCEVDKKLLGASSRRCDLHGLRSLCIQTWDEVVISNIYAGRRVAGEGGNIPINQKISNTDYSIQQHNELPFLSR